jgi:putative acetyltransferase
MNLIFRPIEEKYNKEIVKLIRGVFVEFNIHKPGTVYFDPTPGLPERFVMLEIC